MTSDSRLLRRFITLAAAFVILTSAVAAQGSNSQGDASQQPKSTADAWRQALPQHEEPDPSVAAAGDARRGSPEETREEIERRLGELEQSWSNAVRAGDADSLRRLLAADFTHAGPGAENGAFSLNKAAYVAQAMRDAKTGAHRLDQLRVRVYDEAAVVSGLYVRDETAAGGADGDFAFTDVWVRKAGVWRAVSRHLSPLPAGAAAK
jgi:ketosteroid isomerase-like protein